MSVRTENIMAEFCQKILSGGLKIWKIRQGITFLLHPVHIENLCKISSVSMFLKRPQTQLSQPTCIFHILRLGYCVYKQPNRQKKRCMRHRDAVNNKAIIDAHWTGLWWYVQEEISAEVVEDFSPLHLSPSRSVPAKTSTWVWTVHYITRNLRVNS